MNDPMIEDAVRTHGDRLYRYCLLLLGNRSDAEDAVQDTFLTLVRKAPRFNSPEHEKAWLLKVARNRSLDMLRKRKNLPEPLDDASLPDTGGVPDLFGALSGLPEIYRSALCLHYVEGLSVGEIAAIVKRSPSAVKMRLMKGRELLKNEMEDRS